MYKCNSNGWALLDGVTPCWGVASFPPFSASCSSSLFPHLCVVPLLPLLVISPLFLVVSPVLLLFVSPLLLLRLISPLRLHVVSPLRLLHLLLTSPVLWGVVIQLPLLDGIHWVVVVGWGLLALVFIRGFISLGWIRQCWSSLGGIRLDWLSLVGFTWIGRCWGGFAHVGVG